MKKSSFRWFLGTATAFAFASIVGVSTLSFKSQAATFSDTTDHWGEENIEKWASYEVIVGYNGKFNPDNYITRGEMAVILNAIMDYQVENGNSFSDLSDTWYTEAVLKCNAAELMLGTGSGKVEPDVYISREDACVMIAKALHLPITYTGDSTGFADNGSIAIYAQNAVATMKNQGLILGKPNNLFAPRENITRAEVTTILAQGIDLYLNDAGSYQENITGTVVISSQNVNLTNTHIQGDLILAEGIAEGDIYLSNVQVDGDIIVKGGGSNSVYLTDVTASGEVHVDRVDDSVRLVFAGESSASQVNILNDARIITTDFEGYIGTVSIESGSSIALEGEFARVENTADNAIIILDGEIGTVENNATGVDLTVEAEVTTLVNTASDVLLTINGDISSMENTGAMAEIIVIGTVENFENVGSAVEISIFGVVETFSNEAALVSVNLEGTVGIFENSGDSLAMILDTNAVITTMTNSGTNANLTLDGEISSFESTTDVFVNGDTVEAGESDVSGNSSSSDTTSSDVSSDTSSSDSTVTPEEEEPEEEEPEIVEPEIVEPEIVEPEILEPEILEPEIVEPEILEPEILEPEIEEPEIEEPEIEEPEVELPEVELPELELPEEQNPEYLDTSEYETLYWEAVMLENNDTYTEDSFAEFMAQRESFQYDMANYLPETPEELAEAIAEVENALAVLVMLAEGYSVTAPTLENVSLYSMVEDEWGFSDRKEGNFFGVDETVFVEINGLPHGFVVTKLVFESGGITEEGTFISRTVYSNETSFVFSFSMAEANGAVVFSVETEEWSSNISFGTITSAYGEGTSQVLGAPSAYVDPDAVVYLTYSEFDYLKYYTVDELVIGSTTSATNFDGTYSAEIIGNNIVFQLTNASSVESEVELDITISLSVDYTELNTLLDTARTEVAKTDYYSTSAVNTMQEEIDRYSEGGDSYPNSGYSVYAAISNLTRTLEYMPQGYKVTLGDTTLDGAVASAVGNMNISLKDGEFGNLFVEGEWIVVGIDLSSDTDYQVNYVKINGVEVSLGDDGFYTFTMLAEEVTVQVDFTNISV